MIQCVEFAVFAALAAAAVRLWRTGRHQPDALMLAFQANHDALTLLPNRMFFLATLDEVISGASNDLGMAVLFLDLDRFKWVNDSLGHAAGDMVLVEVASRLRGVVRPQDTVAHFGGDEFVVLCEGTEGQGDADVMAQRIASTLATPLAMGGGEMTLSASIGMAFRPAGSTDSAEDLVRDAAVAMHQAKEQGRDRIVTFDIAARRAAVERHETLTALRRSIGNDELVVHYQPEIDITTGAVVAVEALVRWNHPTRGLLGPGEFIGHAEESGLIVPLGSEVLRVACAQVASWQRSNPALAGLSLSVNLAARQLLAPDLTQVVEEAMADAGLDPRDLSLEITESVLLEDGDTSAHVLRRLKSLGLRIGVDDFGTGFSSLTYLKRFPVDILKIDRSFVSGLGQDREDRAIVASVVDLAHAFGLTTIAEGVETPVQLAELRSLGCEQGQGYLWSRPLPAADVEEWFDVYSNLHDGAGAGGRSVSTPSPVVARTKARRRRHRVLLVDDDHPVRRLLRLILEGDDDFEIVGETADGREAVALARHHRPDLVLLDLAMPAMGGLEALPLIRAVAPDAKVVVLSGLDGASYARSAETQGASAYVLKGTDLTDLCGMLRPILACERPLAARR